MEDMGLLFLFSERLLYKIDHKISRSVVMPESWFNNTPPYVYAYVLLQNERHS